MTTWTNNLSLSTLLDWVVQVDIDDISAAIDADRAETYEVGGKTAVRALSASPEDETQTGPLPESVRRTVRRRESVED